MTTNLEKKCSPTDSSSLEQTPQVHHRSGEDGDDVIPCRPWAELLIGAIDDMQSQVFDGGICISAELQETVAGIVNTSRCLTADTERDLSRARDKLEAQVKHLCDTQARLDAQTRDVTQHEATPAYGATVGSLERYE